LRRWIALAAFLVVAGWLPLRPAESPSGRYAVILQDQPVAGFAAGLSPQGVRDSAAQTSLRSQIERRGVRVTGAVQTLLNAVFVEASEAEAAQIRTMPGVSGVVPVKRFRLKLNRALPLVNVAAAWTRLGGVGNAGAGVKIAIIDSGIDQTRPAFQDASLSIPAGYPRCTGRDCDYTNNKVIAARSYIAQLGAGAPGNPAAESRPDDVSPRDHIGHGTALAMIAAGQTNSGPGATITGVAPQAWLGNYKVFGSPGVNDYTSGDVIIKALEDALNDGMNIANLSIGSPAFYGPLDTGATCGENPGVPCDAEAMAVENAVKAGMLVVVAAGYRRRGHDELPHLHRELAHSGQRRARQSAIGQRAVWRRSHPLDASDRSLDRRHHARQQRPGLYLAAGELAHGSDCAHPARHLQFFRQGA
jgi:minor extracellular serine protease Vpr